MAWLALIASGLCEIVGVAGFDQFTRGSKARGVMLVLVGFGASLTLLSVAMRTIDLGIAYAVFTGIGTAGSTIVGMLFWHEPKNPARIACIGLIILSVIGLRLTS